MTKHHLSFHPALAALEAAGEGTRLRLLALLAEAELTVSELVTILGQSQPRVSRHLKLLVEAGLVERHREGAWAFFSAADRGATAGLGRDILGRLDEHDPILQADRSRLAEVRAARVASAELYFAAQAPDWDRIRALHVAEERVEAAVIEVVGPGPIRALLDLGTGTGRMLELLAPRSDRAVGIDGSHAMLNVARTSLERLGLRNVQLRQGDLYALPVERDGYDLVVIHQVLHYLEDPARALREAARVLRPGGRLVVVDFAPHGDESLRQDHAHRRLGFAREEIERFMRDAGLDIVTGRDLKPGPGEADLLTVSLWLGRDRRVLSDAPPSLQVVA
ncbi:MAG TPA: metalloregulator ArsR/SmtB family transcription factor [Lichenihabitans sp.]|jgi:demethylmenaquinone methyltransferase/2-methoxy-6-polyprenyl-1,4-benzoquinol methylase/ArsR family transcriptional regulator|nr:metalloregulator ArsR/SmtB family transcription factor [Lichenihabitans sp.]